MFWTVFHAIKCPCLSTLPLEAHGTLEVCLIIEAFNSFKLQAECFVLGLGCRLCFADFIFSASQWFFHSRALIIASVIGKFMSANRCCVSSTRQPRIRGSLIPLLY